MSDNTKRNDTCRFGFWLYSERNGNKRGCKHGYGVHEVRRNECIGCGYYVKEGDHP